MREIVYIFFAFNSWDLDQMGNRTERDWKKAQSCAYNIPVIQTIASKKQVMKS